MNGGSTPAATPLLRRSHSQARGGADRPQQPRPWGAVTKLLLGALGGFGAIAVAAIGLAVGTGIWEWWKQAHERPELRFRYLALDLPLEQDGLKALFEGRAPYVQQNEVLDKFAQTAARMSSPVGVRTYPSADSYLNRLVPGEDVMKQDVGNVGSETVWMYSVLPLNRQLIARGEFDNPIARELAAANPGHDGLFYSILDDTRHRCETTAESEHHFVEEVHPTTFVLITLDIENISSIPARELSLVTKRYRAGSGLTVFTTPGPEPHDDATLEQRSFPPGTLRPNEHLLVPLLILVQRARHLMWAETGAPALARQLERPTIAGGGGERGRPSQAFYRSQLKDALTAFYFLGPGLRIEAVRSGGTSFPVRDLAFSDFTYAVLGWGGVGSCPALAVLQLPGPSWNRQGHVLVGAIGRARERTESRELTGFAGELVIREEDRETTHLDFAAVEIFDGTTKSVCLPSPPGPGLTLHRGDEVRIHCPVPTSAAPAHLILTGYYNREPQP
jgi:hypothetical protein